MTNRAKVASECEAPLYKQLEESFIADIVAGRLKPGDVVPSTYTLAEQYGISRVTAVRCYEELKGRGFLTARRGGSTIVNPRLALQSAAGLLQSFEPGETSRYDNGLGELLLKPPTQLLPTKSWMKAMQSVVESDARDYSGSAEGNIAPRLRAAIAPFLMRMRGLSVYPHNLLIFDSKLQALAFVAENFLEPDDTVAVENPGDPLVFLEFSRRALEIKPVPVDREGAAVEHLEPRSGVKLIAVTPSAQYPTGVIMSERRRQQLARFAGQSDAILLEDDGAAMFRFGKQPELALYNKFKDAIHLGSFGTYLGSLCPLAYLIVPDHLLLRLKNSEPRRFTQPTFMHLTLTKLIETGALELAIFKQRAALQKRRQEVLSVLLNEFKDVLAVNAGSTGFDLLLRFHSQLPKEEVMQVFRECGVDLDSLERCYVESAAADRAEILLPLIAWHDPSRNSIERLLAVKHHLTASKPSFAAPADAHSFASSAAHSLTSVEARSCTSNGVPFIAPIDAQSQRLMYTRQ
ncbi:MAG TPA: PLP-dependent aminotransferase family protein [Candidatus Melainabacteria bacterium]|nr:PLP-dependent aminotransferase family protein [Candidatus Melainabacteria bacterium]